MNHDNILSALLADDSVLLVRVVEIDRDAEAPSEPAAIGVRLKDLTGAAGPHNALAEALTDPEAATATVRAATSNAAPDDVYAETLALNQRFEEEQQRPKRSLDVYEYGAMMAARELRQRGRTAITSDDDWGRE